VPLDSLPTSASNQDESPVPAWLSSACGTTGRLFHSGLKISA
jgi:hypothetical protein